MVDVLMDEGSIGLESLFPASVTPDADYQHDRKLRPQPY